MVIMASVVSIRLARPMTAYLFLILWSIFMTGELKCFGKYVYELWEALGRRPCDRAAHYRLTLRGGGGPGRIPSAPTPIMEWKLILFNLLA
jgi:hypothetical protein